MERKNLSFQPFIFSPDRRVLRHLAFWLLYGIYFYLQSLSPDCIKELDPNDVFSFAFTSTWCFLPVCILCVYVSLEIFYPLLVLKKRYITLFLCFLPLFAVAVSINYFFSVLFLDISSHIPIDRITFMRKLTLGYLNSQNAIIAGALALGVRLTKNWYLQKEENLRLAALKARTSLDLEKVKIHPDFLLGSLDNIIGHIKTGNPAAADTIVDLSDRLSRWLYEEEDLV